jgi:hypothetical protein
MKKHNIHDNYYSAAIKKKHLEAEERHLRISIKPKES